METTNVRLVDRTFDVLEALSWYPEGTSIAVLTEKTGIHKSTIYRLLNTLINRGYIVKDETGLYGIIDYSKNIILDTKYDEIKKVYGNDCYVVVENGTKKLVKKDGTDLLTSGFDEITQVLASQENAVIFKKSEKYGIMDLTGKVVIEPQYEDLKEARIGIFIAKKDGQYGIVNILNTTAIEFKYANIAYQEKADLYIADDKDGNTNILDSKQQGINMLNSLNINENIRPEELTIEQFKEISDFLS